MYKMAMFGCALPEGFLLTRICSGGFSRIRYRYEGSIFFHQHTGFPDVEFVRSFDQNNIASQPNLCSACDYGRRV
jgi:hypothetical protein